MTIETIKERIQKAEEKIEKKQGTIARAKKIIANKEAKIAKTTDKDEIEWLKDDIENQMDSIKNAEKEIKETTEKLEGYKAELQKLVEKANSRNVKAILEFLEMWKKNVTKFYLDRFAQYPKAYEQYRKDIRKYEEISYWEWRQMKKNDRAKYTLLDMERREIEEQFKARFGFLETYIGAYSESGQYLPDEFDLNRFQKDLQKDAEAKYDDIIERTNRVVGEIKDASKLTVGAKGELNGYIFGTKGTAKVETIGAGGYNIQCFHFRTLIHEVK